MRPFDPCAPIEELTGFQTFTGNSFMPSLSDIDTAYLFRWDPEVARDFVVFMAERMAPTPRINTSGRLNAASAPTHGTDAKALELSMGMKFVK